MNYYKQEEREHYNSRYDHPEKISHRKLSVYDLINSNAVKAFYEQVTKYITIYKNGTILDYGCASGERSSHLADDNWFIYGIDISEKSIEAGSSISKDKYIVLSVMDCEQMSFDDNYFDIIFDYGTLSSIDQSIAVKELARVLKPGGALICIETLGHHPFGNINRYIKMLFGKRTKWATNNIMTMQSWKTFSNHFQIISLQYFNLISILFAPLLSIVPQKTSIKLLKYLWRLDSYLCELPHFKKYAFKTVTVLKKAS